MAQLGYLAGEAKGGVMNIRNGIKIGYSTSPAFGGQWYASLTFARRHSYSNRTAFGKRTVWKTYGFRALGRFETRKAAVQAARRKQGELLVLGFAYIGQ